MRSPPPGSTSFRLDERRSAYFCDRRLTAGESIHDERLRREWSIDRQFPQALAAIARVVESLPVEVHLHCCHSVYKRQSDVRGDYRPILPRFAGAKIDRLNLEFAYEGTGDISDLDLLPAGIDVGMGVVDVRTEQPQSIEAIESLGAAGAERIDARMRSILDRGFVLPASRRRWTRPTKSSNAWWPRPSCFASGLRCESSACKTFSLPERAG